MGFPGDLGWVENTGEVGGYWLSGWRMGGWDDRVKYESGG
jgi:hypothetical protein